MSVGLATQQDSSASAPPGGEDTLADNGLGSPFCRTPVDLPQSARRNCETADFIATEDPTGDYALDVNINTGAAEWGNDVSATTQNVVGSVWMAFVSITHGLVVMFEWCYSLDLLSGPLLVEITRALHNSRVALTQPWLAAALAVAGVLALYHGVLRRRVTDTLGHALVTFAMIAGGLCIMADPAGTVGALGRWANQAALGTLATVAGGTPNHPERVLATGMQRLFDGVIGPSWCYLEFGDVGWCRDSGSFDGRLRMAALAIARREQSQSGCRSVCGAGVGAKDRALAASATLLRAAHTNGELFLALPANELQRNSVTTPGALLNVLCGRGESADRCAGPTAAQAEFRTQKGTQPRSIGVCLVWIGGLGMLLLFGFLALRLLTAALSTLLYLLLAPVVVLAPAFGDGGRSAFRVWATHLLGALASKLIYSFLLGVALLMTNALLSLTMLGWLAQWLLISAFWWEAFLKRHHMIGLIDGTARVANLTPRDSFVRRVKETIDMQRTVLLATRKSRAYHADFTHRQTLSLHGAPSLGEPHDFQLEAEHDSQQSARDTVRTVLEPRSQHSTGEASSHADQSSRVTRSPAKSPVLDDVREVLAGRKAQLGYGLSRDDSVPSRLGSAPPPPDSGSGPPGSPNSGSGPPGSGQSGSGSGPSGPSTVDLQ